MRGSINSLEQWSDAPVPVPGGRAPDPWNRAAAIGAITILLHSIFRHQKPVALDERGTAVMAAGVLPLADISRQVPRIHVLQSRPLTILDDLHQIVHDR